MADLDAGDDGLWQDGLQDVHGFRIILKDALHNGLNPGGIRLHPQLGRDTGQQLPLLHWFAVHTYTHTQLGQGAQEGKGGRAKERGFEEQE